MLCCGNFSRPLDRRIAMAKTTIRIKTRHNTELFVPANILDGGLVAVHPFLLNTDGGYRKGWYTVTHIPTGKSIVPEIHGRDRAVHCAELVNLPCLKSDKFRPIPRELKRALANVDSYLRATARI